MRSSRRFRDGASDEFRTGEHSTLSVVVGDQRIDPRDPAFFTRPDFHEVLARLRSDDPVHLCEEGFWVLTRYEDIRDVSRDPTRFCSSRGALGERPRSATWRRRCRPAPSSTWTRPSMLRSGVSSTAGSLHVPWPGWRSSCARARHPCSTTSPRPRRSISSSSLSAPFPLNVIGELLGIDATDRTTSGAGPMPPLSRPTCHPTRRRRRWASCPRSWSSTSVRSGSGGVRIWYRCSPGARSAAIRSRGRSCSCSS